MLAVLWIIVVEVETLGTGMFELWEAVVCG